MECLSHRIFARLCAVNGIAYVPRGPTNICLALNTTYISIKTWISSRSNNQIHKLDSTISDTQGDALPNILWSLSVFWVLIIRRSDLTP